MTLYAIYEQFQTDILRFARSLTKREGEAEDLAQQAYVKALEQGAIFEGMHPQQAKAWFFMTVKHLYIDEYRKHRRIGSFEENEVSLEPDPVDALALEEILESLEPELRETVILKHLYGYKSAEISKIVGVNPSTVRSRLSRAMWQLRQNKGGFL